MFLTGWAIGHAAPSRTSPTVPCACLAVARWPDVVSRKAEGGGGAGGGCGLWHVLSAMLLLDVANRSSSSIGLPGTRRAPLLPGWEQRAADLRGCVRAGKTARGASSLGRVLRRVSAGKDQAPNGRDQRRPCVVWARRAGPCDDDLGYRRSIPPAHAHDNMWRVCVSA